MITQNGEFIPSFVLKSNLARLCCLIVAFISALLTSKLIAIAMTGQAKDIIHMWSGKEAKNWYGMSDESRFDLRNNWL